MALSFLPPMQFMQSNVVVLPLDPRGPLRELHERIKSTKLVRETPRFAFTPHVTLNLFRELPPNDVRELSQDVEGLRRLLAVREKDLPLQTATEARQFLRQLDEVLQGMAQ